MNRRKFLKGLFTATAIATIPKPVLDAFIKGTTDIIVIDGITINYTNGILILDGGESGATMAQMYEAMQQNIGVKNQDNPVSLTDNTYSFLEGWKLTLKNMTIDGDLNLGKLQKCKIEGVVGGCSQDRPVIDMGGNTDLTIRKWTGRAK